MGDKYEGGRSYDDLKKFADENLGPSCGPSNLDLCSEEKKAEIEGYMNQDQAELQKIVDEKTEAQAAAEKTFKDEVSKLQKKYEELMKEKDDAVAKASENLGIMRSVLAAAKDKASKDEL